MKREMTRKRIFPLQLMLIATVLLVSAISVHATIINVPSDQPTIQAGIDAAAHGDTVSLAAGIYTENIVIEDKLLTLMSVSGQDSTFIEPEHADSSILTVLSSEYTLPLRGLTFRNGEADEGAAIRSFYRSLDLRECNILECDARYYAGINVDSGAFHAAHCMFEDNSAIRTSVINIRTSEAVIDSCSFLRNTSSAEYGGSGGTICIAYGSVTIESCTFEDNQGCHSTVLNSQEASISLNNCTIRRGRKGDCLYDVWYTTAGSIAAYMGPIHVSNCLFEGLDHIAIGTFGNLIEIHNSTIVDNYVGIFTDVFCGPGIQIENSIIANNEYKLMYIMEGSLELMQISSTDIYGNLNGDWVDDFELLVDSNGNFSADPRFCDPDNGDYHIDAYSFCAPEYSPNGELVGALGVGCQTDIICGDPNISGGIDIDDVVYLIDYLFLGGMPPMPVASGDVDCLGGIDIDDAVYLIMYIFQGGNSPCDPNGDGEPDCGLSL